LAVHSFVNRLWIRLWITLTESAGLALPSADLKAIDPYSCALTIASNMSSYVTGWDLE
jgi:hypothetical protein